MQILLQFVKKYVKHKIMSKNKTDKELEYAHLIDDEDDASQEQALHKLATEIAADHSYEEFLKTQNDASLPYKTNDDGIVEYDFSKPPGSYMRAALIQASQAFLRHEVPVGAVVVDPREKKVIARASNRMLEMRDPTAHAEMMVIKKAAAKLQSVRLDGYDLYVTLEPCPMCASAIALARFRRVYFAAYDPKGGGIEHGPRIFEQSSCNHKPEVYGGVMAQVSSELLQNFFQHLRGN